MDKEVKNTFRSGYSKGMGLGLALMLIGVIFLGFNFGFIPWKLKNIIISWQMIFLFLGVVNLFKRQFISGIVLISVGGFFIIPKIFPALNGEFVHTFWPLLLIGAGVVILLQRTLGPKYFSESGNNKWNQHRYHHSSGCNSAKRGQNSEGFSKNSVFGSGEHIIHDPEFKGGELNAIFGGITLDLRKTNLAVGDTCLDINAVFGGVTIYVPNDWLIETHLDSVFGGFQDNRMPIEPTDATRRLIISGSCVFGGGELRN